MNMLDEFIKWGAQGKGSSFVCILVLVTALACITFTATLAGLLLAKILNQVIP